MYWADDWDCRCRIQGGTDRRYDAPIVPDAHEWTKWTRRYVERAAPRYRDKLIRSRGGSNDREVGAVIGAATVCERAEQAWIGTHSGASKARELLQGMAFEAEDLGADRS